MLLLHLRERQAQHGVRAFYFHHVLCNNVLESAQYPDSAQAVLDSEDDVVFKPAETTKMEEVAKASAINPVPLPVPPVQENPPIVGPASLACGPEQHYNPVPPPGWSQTPGPNNWPPHFMSATNSIPPPNGPPFPLPYYPQFMPQWGVQPAWGPPPFAPVEQPLQPPQHPMPGFHAPTAAVGPGMTYPPPVDLPGIFNDPHPHPPADQVHGFHDPVRAAAPGMPVPYLFHPPNPFNNPHPIPSGDPPFYSPVSLDPGPINHSMKTPTKKLTQKTPGKTPGKRKREGEDTPSKKPTRASTRTRTPRKPFEID